MVVMKFLHLIGVCNRVSGISLNRGIQTSTVLLARTRGKMIPRENYRRTTDIKLNTASNLEETEDEDSDEELDTMNIENAYDMNEAEENYERKKLERIITIRKFFREPPAPPTLTCNERFCIKYLHKTDPVQWNVQALSESFPATPESIKKILKGNFNPSEEKKRKIDEKVLKNWQLLAEGKLKAAPEILEHLKKFVNRREVLLEQIKNEKFYLPEIKKEIIWNNGEMNGILAHYEKALKNLVNKETDNINMLGEKSEKDKVMIKKTSSLDLIHEKIDEFQSTRNVEGKESFTLGKMINTYNNPLTFEELEKKLMQKTERKKKLHLTEQAIVESALNSNYGSNSENLTKSNASNSEQILNSDETVKSDSLDLQKVPNSETNLKFKSPFNKYKDRQKLETLKMNEENMNFVPPDNRTKYVESHELGKVLNELGQTPEAKSPVEVNEKKKIDFSDPERLKREELYYEKQVKDIENTEFWNNKSSSQQRLSIELQKKPLGGPDLDRGSFFSDDVYPERIKIPKNKRRSGLTFRVRDCFYDDDGEFLYRVPGMVK